MSIQRITKEEVDLIDSISCVYEIPIPDVVELVGGYASEVHKILYHFKKLQGL